MTLTTATNSTSPNTVRWATADSDAYDRETQLYGLAENFDLHDHTSGKNLGVRRANTADAPAAAGQVRVNTDEWQWWGSSAAAVQTAVRLAGAQTITGEKNFNAKTFVGDDANGSMTLGLTINQAGADNEIVSLKSSDVAHGVTDVTETDTYGYLAKIGGATGGLYVVGLAESAVEVGLDLVAVAGTDATGKNASAAAYIVAEARKINGVTFQAPGAGANLFAVRSSNNQNEFIVETGGNLYVNGSTSLTAFDDEDDAALLEVASLAMDPGRAKDFKFSLAQDIERHAAALAAGGVIAYNDDGRHFISYKGMLGLLIDAIRQVTHAQRVLEARVTPLLEAR